MVGRPCAVSCGIYCAGCAMIPAPAFPPLPSLRAGKLRAGVYSGEMEISTPLKAGVRDSGSIERGTRTLHSG